MNKIIVLKKAILVVSRYKEYLKVIPLAFQVIATLLKVT